MVWFPEKDIRWQVAALFTTEAAGDCDRLERVLIVTGWYILPAPFAGDHELLPGCRTWEHEWSIGEYKARVHRSEGS